jgi:hypothetical protein
MTPKRRSKIARLPKAIRDEINLMLDEGATYQTVIEWLASRGHPDFSKNNLFHWKNGGYQDWLQEKERKEQARALRSWSAALAAREDPTLLANALSNFAAAKLHRLLCTLDFDALSRELQRRPEICIRYFNSVLRTGRISLEAVRVNHLVREQIQKRAPTDAEIKEAEIKLGLFGPEDYTGDKLTPYKPNSPS